MSHRNTCTRFYKSGFLGLVIFLATLIACSPSKGPGAGDRWSGYQSLASSAKNSYSWLVVKCQLSDVATIPSGLDTDILQFFGIAGTGYGNIVDYFHDVSYNHAFVIARDFLGWVRAPFSRADMSFADNGPRFAKDAPRVAKDGRLAPASARAQRVKECLEAIPEEQSPDLDQYYGVVVINNDINDGGACATGQISLNIKGRNHKLACVWFDPNSLSTEFAAHEIAHGLGLDHSYDDSARNCGGVPGEYCDPWDLMSAQRTFQFEDKNFLIQGKPSGGGPGLGTPGLLRMGWIPAANQRRFDYEGKKDQTFVIRALSHPVEGEPLVILFDAGSTQPFESWYTVEYRQGDGWDRGLSTDLNVPSTVRAVGGAVIVHKFRSAGAPATTMIKGENSGALLPFDTLVFKGETGLVFHVTVNKIDTAAGAATVTVGFGNGPKLPDFSSGVHGVRKINIDGHP